MKDLVLKIVHRVLRFYAIKVIKRRRPFVVIITGSVGKTTTKEAIYKILADKYPAKVRKSFGNLNTEIGLPLAILGYDKVPHRFLWPVFLIFALPRLFSKKYPLYLVLEAGVEKPGDMKYLMSIVKPDLAIVTSLAPAHSANFKTIEDYQHEKLLLLDYLKESGQAIVNSDDPVLAKLQDGRKIKSVAINNAQANFKAEGVTQTLAGVDCRVGYLGRKISLKMKLLGRQMAYAGLFGLAAADFLHISPLRAAESLEKIKPSPGRMSLVDGREGVTIIDDSYNANPASVKAALDFLSEVTYSGRKVAILGNMNELGQYEDEAHQEIGRYTNGRVNLAVFVGPWAKMMADSSGSAGNLTFQTRKKLEAKLEEIIKPGDLVLVKASESNNYFEEIVRKLMKEPKKAGELLVRQSPSWLKRKKHRK